MLKPGNLPVSSNTSPFDSSLAAEIEKQLNQLLSADGIKELPTDDSPETRDRRRMFVAIARGVIQHLYDNRTSIKIHLGGGITRSPTLDVEW